MKKSFLKTTVILIHGLIWQVACFNSADRNNPLDPNSKSFKNIGAVSGQTLSFYSPFTALENVEVRMEPGSFVSMSNNQGQFFFENIPVRNYHISAMKEGYASFSDSVEVQLGQTTLVNMNLDGLPLSSSISITSSHISRWWPQNDLFLLEIAAQVDDPDGLGDIEIVQLEIPELNFLDTLEVTQIPGMYEKKIKESRLPEKNLQNILGRKILIKALDRAGFGSTSPPKFLVRIIEQTPEFVSPLGDSLEGSRPILKWKSIDLPFDFTFSVEVVRVDFDISNTVWSLSGIDKSITSSTVADSLISGAYFWTISVVDEFGNRSRSKEASFFIK